MCKEPSSSARSRRSDKGSDSEINKKKGLIQVAGKIWCGAIKGECVCVSERGVVLEFQRLNCVLMERKQVRLGKKFGGRDFPQGAGRKAIKASSTRRPPSAKGGKTASEAVESEKGKRDAPGTLGGSWKRNSRQIKRKMEGRITRRP